MRIAAIILRSFLVIATIFAANSELAGRQKGRPGEIITPESKCPKVALVLSGGGARGFAQIGAIDEIMKAGIEFDYIVGTSIGSIIGGMIACGYNTAELDSIVNTTDWNELFSLLEEKQRSNLFIDQKYLDDRSIATLRFKNFELVMPEAISVGTRFDSFLQKIIWNGVYKADGDFDNLKYPFRCVTTDIARGRSISLGSGDLARAIRASATVPLQFSPVRKDSMVLVDGGLMANIPIEAAREFDPDIIIAINTASPLLNRDELDTPWNIADQVVSIMMKHFSQEARKQADIIIEPKISNHKNVDFSGLDSLIVKGRLAAKTKIPEIRELINSKRQDKKHITSAKGSQIPGASETSDPRTIKNINTGKISEITVSNKNDEIYSEFSKYLSKRFNGYYFTNNNAVLIREALLKYFRNHGLSFADIAGSEFDENSGSLEFVVTPGYISSIKVNGNEAVRNFMILREMEFRPGDPARAEDLVRAWENLVATDLFSDVAITIDRDPASGNVGVSVDVKEAGTQIIKIGGRVDNEYNAQAGIDLIQENLFNVGARFATRLVLSNRLREFSVSLQNPRILNTMLRYSLSGYYRHNRIYEYKGEKNFGKQSFERNHTSDLVQQRYGAILSVGSQMQRKGRLFADFRFERQRYFNLDSVRNPFYFISTVRTGAIFDTENRSEFATEGRRLELSLETTLFQSQKSVGFSKAMFSFSSNHSFEDHTIIPSMFFGFADETLPLPEFFNMGGQDNFYGMRMHEERGRQIMRTSLGYRYLLPFDIFFDTYFFSRYDLGAVWGKPEQIKFGDLKHGIGGGIALDTPLGPAKFSMGRSFYFSKKINNVMWGPILLYFRIGINL
jgi:NTE family protein